MKTKFTKGNWKIHQLFKRPLYYNDNEKIHHMSWWIMQEKTDKFIGEIKFRTKPSGYPSVDSLKEFVANAKLIAAAPDLFLALSAIIDTLDDNINPDDIPLYNEIQTAKKAIKKATE